MVFQVVLLSVDVVTMAGVIIIGALVFKARKDKMMKAASPPLLYLMLIGAFVLYSEVVIGWLPASRVTCMARPWIRHVGFAITYGALLIKTWRISAIMRMVKAKVVPTRDAQLFRAVAILILISGAYMLVWTLADPLQPQLLPPPPEALADDVTHSMMTSDVLICISPFWDYIISAGEFCFLVWGGTLCYQARKAPDIYNETRPISYALWNEALWGPFYIYASCLLSVHPAINMNFLLCFLRVQCTVTVTLLLLFVPKFRAVYSTLRELRGTVADVYGAKRVHRLSLMISKNGTIKTIYCIPCGPLTYTEGPEEDTPDSVSETGDNNKENHYTKAEVDALIEMVSRLKNEKSLYKTQVRRLYHLLKEYKHRLPINSLPVYLVAETPEREGAPHDPELLPEIDGLPLPGECPAGGATRNNNNNVIWQDLSSTSAYSSSRTLPNNESPDGWDQDAAQLVDGCACALTSHSRKASTVTTYLSNASETDSWTGNGSDGIGDDLLRCANARDVSGAPPPNCVASPVSDYSSYQESLPVERDEPSPRAGGERPASRAGLVLDLADDVDVDDAEFRSRPPPVRPDVDVDVDDDDGAGDYPRLVDAAARGAPDIRDFISTICGDVKDNKTKGGGGAAPRHARGAAKSHEMETLTDGKSNNILSNAVKLSAKAFERRRKGSRTASDKMSFVMYI